MKICVVGLGYIGLPTATMFASAKAQVLGVDVNPMVVDTVNSGGIHIVEPALDVLVQRAVKEGYLRAATAPADADAFLIAVPTPFKGDHVPDVSYVEAAAKAVAPVLRKGAVVILESTSPVGTTEKMIEWLSEARPDLRFPVVGDSSFVPDVFVAYCPERVLPGKVVEELVSNDRTVGGITALCAQKACDVYKIFVQGQLIITDARTAEMCKLTENAFRDVNIAFANELSLLCDRLGINVWELISLANRHPRVNILNPGCGVGGHCIAVDPWFIVDAAPDLARMIATARNVNDGKPKHVLDKIDAAAPIVEGGRRTVAVLGIAFKPDIDDLRESPAFAIAQDLTARDDLDVLIVEPHISALPERLAGARLVGIEEAVLHADVVAVLVKHGVFVTEKALLLKHKNVVDAVGLFA
ncbi:UDP-N-acetyl-D-mannosamine dehydrogenase [Stenotrophomonas sp.]|uniref:UDP-N-acetyl-D-mannosamine dehydrogenase n=1 Tax=Stenotrophomonas sp. TaxID=69392 RepID=UPI00289A824E|nr:UDP-N-acetyl-D-mannosamine dehydrogenase [Stenotrophomonas sp.]